MCSVILSITAEGVFVAANRDEMINRAWEPPAEYWPGICGGRDVLAGGTWLALNRHNVLAAVLNREGTLGPAAGKKSRGELPLLALQSKDATAAAKTMGALDDSFYRPFNLVLADATAAFFIRGLGTGQMAVLPLAPGVHMVTAGEPDDFSRPRIAKYLPRFQAAPVTEWAKLLADHSGGAGEQINIKPSTADGFGTVCASLISLPRTGGAIHEFAAGPPDVAAFRRVDWGAKIGADD